jgi:hypothetical protein
MLPRLPLSFPEDQADRLVVRGTRFICLRRSARNSCAGHLTRPPRFRVLTLPKSGIMLSNRQSIWSQSPHDDKHPQFLWKSWPSGKTALQALDRANNRCLRHRSPVRHNPQPRRPYRRKRDLATAAYRAEPPGETTPTHQRRSHSTGPLGPLHPVLATASSHRST